MLGLIVRLVRALFRSDLALIAENLAMRQQLIVLKRSIARPKITPADRVFWVWVSRFWKNWRGMAYPVTPLGYR